VEDEVINQKIISSILKSADYEVEVAPDGIVALMQIAKEKFDLILSDIAMPNFDGYQLLEYMKQNNIKIPVVFMSGYTSEEDEIKGLRMGAAEYIKKPIEKDILLLRLGKILNQ
jgi:CheY-like chemotaxis protein